VENSNDKKPFFGIVTEFMEKGSLYSIIKKVREHDMTRLSDDLIGRILVDISKGMRFLHSHNPVILHRDLKSENILVNKQMQAKIADLGLSRIQPKKRAIKRMGSRVGTPNWAAPEVINKGQYSVKSDIWSFGIIVWELATYELPFADIEHKEIASSIKDGERVEIPDDCNDILRGIMVNCLIEHPDSRPTFESIQISLETHLTTRPNSVELLDVTSVSLL